MEQIISKEELDKISEESGEARGATFKNALDFVLKKEGPDGLKKIENLMEELGYPIKSTEIKLMNFYPLNSYLVLQLAIKNFFNYDDKDFQEMGEFMAKSSMIMRLFMKYFASLDNLIKQGPRAWRMYFSTGELKVVEINKEKKYMVSRLEDFAYGQLHCQIIKGFYSSIIQMILRSKVTCEEIKCPLRGDEYHEFLFKWENDK